MTQVDLISNIHKFSTHNSTRVFLTQRELATVCLSNKVHKRVINDVLFIKISYMQELVRVILIENAQERESLLRCRIVRAVISNLDLNSMSLSGLKSLYKSTKELIDRGDSTITVNNFDYTNEEAEEVLLDDIMDAIDLKDTTPALLYGNYVKVEKLWESKQ